MKVLKKLGSGYVAQFDCHLRPFVFHIDVDGKMPPRTVSLLFEEADEQGVVLADPIRFGATVQTKTFQTLAPKDMPDRYQQTLAQELSRDMSPGVLPWILERIKAAGYDEDARLSAFRMSREDIAGGILVSYTEVMT